MTISTFYTEGLKAHADMVQDFKINKLKFQPKIRKYKTELEDIFNDSEKSLTQC